MPTRCFCPPESSSQRRSSRPSRPVRSRSRKASATSSGSNRRRTLCQNPVRPSVPQRTFSMTVKRPTSACSWKIMPIRRRARRSIGARELREGHSVEDDRARRRLHEPVDGSQKRALACARRSYEADDLVLVNLQRYAAQRRLAGSVPYNEVPDRKHRTAYLHRQLQLVSDARSMARMTSQCSR